MSGKRAKLLREEARRLSVHVLPSACPRNLSYDNFTAHLANGIYRQLKRLWSRT